MAQRWVLLSAAPRQPPAQRPVETPWRKHREQEGQAFQTLGRTACACAAEAHQALARFAPDLQTTFLPDRTICPTPRDGKRGRPGAGAQPDQVVDSLAGARASRLTARRALIDQPRCFILATNARAEDPVSSQAVLDGDQGQAQAERGGRFLKAPPCWASARALNKPERLMALLMGMTVCLRVYAA